MKILLINGSIVGEKTKILLEAVKTELEKFSADYEIKELNLEKYDMQFADGRPKDDYNEDTQSMIDEMEAADGYIIATPIFQGSIPGALKNLFDLISPKVMRYKPVAIVANGGTFQHHLVIENQLKPILDYFRSLITPNYVYTQSAHFSHVNEIIDEDVKFRIEELARVFYYYMQMSSDLQKGDNLSTDF
ncbi:NADH-dependent FMN reductase [Halalkalibacillus sediminis]|uniref:NADH-dependent FMN reductase n=1 Tax=Halalkalibacillus sediminis TaxID=2018042 RepID=A0A2I0QRU4_9BACI|nr:NADPH-dependent FMN reductase [Halalkalibacillus sediminis]PKR77048.1 NADH-dependent FMN reductase [Halalkalibacillus sediminis]